jgi:hypothetical protein
MAFFTVFYVAANGEVVSSLQESARADWARATVEATGHEVVRVTYYPPPTEYLTRPPSLNDGPLS